jgi:hypothetical protein
MVGRNPRYEVDYIIVAILEEKYPKSIRNKGLVEEISRRCQQKRPSISMSGQTLPIAYKPAKQLEEPAPSTLSRRLTDLYERMVLDRRVDKARGTHYILEKEFKQKLDSEKNKEKSDKEKRRFGETYIHRALSIYSAWIRKSEEHDESEPAITFEDPDSKDNDNDT